MYAIVVSFSQVVKLLDDEDPHLEWRNVMGESQGTGSLPLSRQLNPWGNRRPRYPQVPLLFPTRLSSIDEYDRLPYK